MPQLGAWMNSKTMKFVFQSELGFKLQGLLGGGLAGESRVQDSGA